MITVMCNNCGTTSNIQTAGNGCHACQAEWMEETFERTYVEPGMKVEWIQEDEDYARQCADEKWRSQNR